MSKQIAKRVLAGVLCFALICSCIPGNFMSVFATEKTSTQSALWKQVGALDTTTGCAWKSLGGYGDEQAILLGWNSSLAQTINDKWFVYGGNPNESVDGTEEDEVPSIGYFEDETANGSVYKYYRSEITTAVPGYTNTSDNAITMSTTAQAAKRMGKITFYSDSMVAAKPNGYPILETPGSYVGTAPKYNTYANTGVENNTDNVNLGFFDKTPISAGMTNRVIAQFDVPESKADTEYLFTVYADTLNYVDTFSEGAEIFLMDLDGNILSERVVVTADQFGKTGAYLTFRIKGSFLLCMDKPNNAFGFSAFFFDLATTWKQIGDIDNVTGGNWQTKGYGSEQAILLGWTDVETKNDTIQNSLANYDNEHYFRRFGHASISAWHKDTSSNAVKLNTSEAYRAKAGNEFWYYRGANYVGAPTFVNTLETPANYTGTVPMYEAYTAAGSTAGAYLDTCPFPEGLGRRVALHFNAPDETKEYAFRIYADTRNIPYPVDEPIAFSFLSIDGSQHHATVEMSTADFGRSGGYITFHVQGSFVLCIDKQNYVSGDTTTSQYFGVSAFFFDPLSEPETFPEKTATKDFAHYANLNTALDGNWVDTYGSLDAYLLGYQYTGVNTESFNLSRETYDYCLNNKVFVRTEGDVWFCFPATGDDVLYNPNTAAKMTFNVYDAASGRTANRFNRDITGAARTYTFSGVSDEPYLFTLYTNNDCGRYNPENAGEITLMFYDEMGNLVLRDVVSTETFNTRAYISYVVKGDFTLIIEKDNKSTYFGFSGFFFDEIPENCVSNLTVTEGSQLRSAQINWTETNAAEGTVVVLERKAENGQWEEVAALDAGVKTYLDTDLKAGVTYEYRIYTRVGVSGTYITDSAIYAVPGYTPTVLTLDKADYTCTGNEDEVTIGVTLKTKDGVFCANMPVYLNLEYDFTTYQTDNLLTDSNGNATFTFCPKYMGEAVLTAMFDDDDANQYQHTQSESATLFAGETKWERPAVLYKISDAIMPGDYLSISGYGIINDNMSLVQVMYAPHTAAQAPETPVETAKVLPLAQKDAEGGTFVMAKLPEDTEPGLYDIWVNNGYGWSEPMVLNAPRPLYISEYEAWAGQTLKIVGRNMESLQFGASYPTDIRLVNGNTVVETNVTRVTPYCLEFSVKPGTALATYEVQVSNDNGLTWIGLESDQTLTVVAEGNDYLGTGLAWMGDSDEFKWNNRFNVTSYYYTSNGSNYAPALSRAITAAVNAGGGVVYFPNGTYQLESQINIPSNVVVMGESTEGTVLVYAHTSSRMFNFSPASGDTDKGHVGFANFTVKTEEETVRPDAFFWLCGNGATVPDERDASEFFLYGIKLDYGKKAPTNGYRGMGSGIVAKERFLIENCESDCWGSLTGYCKMTQYATIRNNTVTVESGGLYNCANYVFFEDNIFSGHFGEYEDSEYTNNRNVHGIAFQANAYVEGNEVKNIGSKRTGDVSNIHNDGETYFSECTYSYNFGEVVASTANTITVDMTYRELQENFDVHYNYLGVVIHEGRGMGQLREVESIDVENGVVTVTEDWDVKPDHTSRFSFLLPSENITIYNNKEENAAKGVYLYGYCHDAVVANHTGVNTEGVFMLGSNTWGTSARVYTSYFNTVRDCTFTGVSPRSQYCNISAAAGRAIDGKNFYSTQVFGTEIRNNTLIGDLNANPVFEDEEGNYICRTEAVKSNGICMYVSGSSDSEDQRSGDIINTIIQGNKLVDMDQGIGYTAGNRGILESENEFVNVTTPVYEYTTTWELDCLLSTGENLTLNELMHVVALWDNGDKNVYCGDLSEMDVAVDQVDALTANSTQSEIDAAMRALRTAYGNLDVHKFDSGVVTAQTAITLESTTYTCQRCGATKVVKTPRTETLWGTVGEMDKTTQGMWQTMGYGTEQAMLLGWNLNVNGNLGINTDGSPVAGYNSGKRGGSTTAYGETARGNVLHVNDSSITVNVYGSGSGNQLSSISTKTDSTGRPIANLEAPEDFTGVIPQFNTYLSVDGSAADATIDGLVAKMDNNAARRYFPFTGLDASQNYYFTVYMDINNFHNGLDAQTALSFVNGNKTAKLGETVTVTASDFGRNGGYVTFYIGGVSSFYLVQDATNSMFSPSAFFFDTEPVYPAPEGIDEALYASISLDGTIGVNYGMNIGAAGKEDDAAAMVFTQAEKSSKTVKLADATTSSGLYWFTYQVAAKEMTDVITGKMSYTDSQGEANRYQVTNYVKAVLGSDTCTEQARTLLTAMVNYGTYCQTYWNYHTEYMANSFLTDAEKISGMADVTAETVYEHIGTVKPGTGVRLAYASLLLKSGTVLRLSFPTSQTTGKTFKLVDGDQEIPLKLTAREGTEYSYVDITDIAAAKLDDTVTVKIYNGTTLVSTVQYSAMAYIYTVMTESADEKLLNVVKALYLYNQAADTYFAAK